MEFDYIVVGAGSSGCILAAELARDPAVSVLVLEAGPPAEDHPEVLRASGYKQAFINPELMWDRVSEPQPGCAGNRLFMGSGRTTGGSGAINAMVYTRGDRRDYAEWRCPGWTWDDLVPDFEAVETRLRVRRLPPTRFTEACIEAAEDAGFRRKEDLNDGDLCGYLGYEWMNADPERDVRNNSYATFLKPRLGQNNLTLLCGAAVERVALESGRAVGVCFRRQGSADATLARARREVILCAGTLETPRLLMLSGIGPADELRALGIEPRVDLPAVGRNLQDHPNVSVFFRGKQPTDCTWAQLYGFHRASPDSTLPPDQADTCYVFYSARSSFREGALRLLPLMLLPLFLYRKAWLVKALRALLSAVFALPPVRWLVERMYGVVVILGKPRSRGRVRLLSADPRAQALIDPNYFGDSDDLDTVVRGVRLARKITAAPALKTWGNGELIPGARARSDEALRTFVRKNAMTTYHYAGTCRMGSLDDPDGAVVSDRLEVHGVRGLRIADASVIPSVPVSAMNAPSMVIGYRASQLIQAARAGLPTALPHGVPGELITERIEA